MAADVEGVQRLLEELHRHSKENFPDSEINDPAALVEQLRIAVLALDPRSPADEADVALFSSFVFESQVPRDLLSFVMDTTNTSPQVTKKARMAALKAVGDFVKRLKGTPHVDRYAMRIKDGVWAVFSKETMTDEVKSRALRPLRELLKLRPPSLAADRWDVPGMWASIKEQYRLGSSKISAGVKGELLKLAGSLLLVYGRDVPELAEGAETMLGWCDTALQNDTKNKQLGKAQALQPAVVAGALACIDLACSAGFEERYTYTAGESATKPNTKLYMFLLRAAHEGSADGLSRFEVPAKALRFFRRHANLFSDNVGSLARALQLFNIMEKCSTAGGKSSRLKLKKHALPAIEAILREVAKYIASKPQRKDTLDRLEGTFLKLLESAKPTTEETTIGLAGIAALSPAATALSSYQEAADVTDRLLVCLDSARGRLDTVGFADEDGDSEEENAGDEEISGTSGGEAGAAVLRKGISLKVEAQFLRTLACRAGVLGGVFAREDAASAGVAAMDISGGTNDVTKKRGAGAAGVGGSVPGHVMRRLQTLALRLVERYALLSERDRGLTCRGLCQLCLAFCGPGQGDNLSRMLGVVVQKGVSLAGTMENPGGGFDDAGEPNSAPVRWVAPVDPITGAVDARLCFLYADLWRRVMNPGTEELEPLQAWGGAMAVSIIYGDSVTPEVYDAVLGAVLTAIKRLDLRYTYGTPEEGGRPIPLHPTDQNMFLNLVSFCQDLLPTCRPDLLQEWVPILCPELVKRSLERPLVSGFYRLVTVVFKETARTGYFDDGPLSPFTAASVEVVSSPSGSAPAAAAGAKSTGGVVTGAHTSTAVGRGNEASVEEGSGGDGGRLACRRVLCRYLDWMTVRLGGFRDELLAACTEALLSAPVGLLGGDLGPLVPALKVALTSGASHLPTAAIAVGALERWEEETPALLRPHLDEILPHLDRHLSGGGGGGDGRSAEKARRSKGGKAESSATRKKGAAGAGAGGEDASGEEIRRKDLRRRIVRFLGRLGGRNHVVAGDASQALSNSLAWDTKPRIVLGVPFQGQQRPLSICLDGVLQRLVELALHEGARQTKTLAAECLHALVVYMVGCTATDPSSGQQGRPGDFSKLFRRVFPAVLRLAVDLDETTRTLFSKLSMQLVRWFSQAQTDNDDTLALLDCLGEGAAAEEGGPLREVCARGVVEFLRYAIKQSTKRQQAEGPVAVDALLTRVFALATHPDKNRRLGGLMAFNQLCRPLREETALLDRYALRLLHVALISLRRAHHDHSALGVADAASSAVDRALRMVHESVAHKGDRADLLREKDGRGELRSVQQMAAWAWDQIGAVETRFRRKCMTVLLALCPLVVEESSDSDDPNAPSPSDNEGTRTWVWLRLKESGRGGVSEAVRVFESSVSQGRAIHSLAAGVADGGSGSALEVEGGDPSATEAAGRGDGEDEQRYDADKSEWDQIATSADCYNFARETGIITAGELFLGKTEVDGSSSSRGKSGASQGEERAFSKKRKASSTGVAGDDVGTTTRTTRPHVLRSLAGAMERFGAFLEDFSFQTLVGEEGGEEAFPDAEIAQGIGGHRLASTSTSGRMSTGATVAGASAGRPLVVDDPGLLPTEQAAAQLSRAVLLRRGFTLLAGCLSDDGGGRKDDTRGSGPSGDEMAALLVKEGLWSRRAQLVLIYSLAWPWAGGLLPRASDGDEVEQFLPAAAERLLKHWKTLDRAARPGNEFSKTLRDLLQVRVFKEVGTRASAGDGGGSGCFGTFDLCQWILSQSLSSQEALSRPFFVVRAGRTAASSSSTADTAGGAPGGRSAGGDARRLQHRHRSRRVPQPPDDELTGRVIRAYRSFANAGIFGSVSDGDSLRLATGLWSTVLRLPEGLRPASEHRAKTALRLAIDLGLPTTGGTAVVDGSSKTASILASLLDVRPAKRASAGAGRGAGATQGALFYRRFSEPVHEAILKRGAGCPWPALCKSLVDACLSTNTTDTGAAGARDGGLHPLLAAQAFSILEGVLTLQSEQQRVRAAALLSSRMVTTRMMDPGETVEAIVPEFRRLVDDPDWGPPPPPTANVPSPAPKKKAREGEGSSATAAVGPGGRMLRESLRLCHRLLRLAAAVQSTGAYTAKKAVGKGSPSSSTSSCFNQLLEMSAVLVAGTLGSASPAVDASAKADALTLVPFLRPCLTRKARDYGHSPATPSASGGQRDGNATGAGAGIVLPALEEMVARHFPIENSHEPEEGSEQATTFARLLRGLLAAFVRCGDLGLLELLFGSLAEGRKHLHYSWVSRALDAFVSWLDVERDGVAEAVFGFCLDKVASNRVAASTKATLFDKVCLPMVRRCPVEVSRKLYLSVSPDAGSGFKPISSEGGGDGAKEGVPVLKRLLAVVGRRSDEKLFKDKALLASCCLLLIEALYDMLDLADLQSLADEAFAKKDALKEVTTGIVKAWKAVCRFKRRYDLPWLELRCRRAAFCCVCTVVRSTQSEQKWFNNLVWADSLYDKASSGGAAAVADKTSVLALVLDMEKEHKFEVTPPFFRTSPLVPARPPLFGGGEGGPHGGASGRGRRRGMTASAMLSQSSLAFGGDSLAGGAEQVSDNGNGVGGGGGGNAAAEDVRETYSSQAALAEPGGVLDGDDGGAGTASQSTQNESQSQGDMAPVFGAGAMEASGGRGRGAGSTEDKEEVLVLVLEESHLNKEQCMRSLLLVVQTEDRLFGDSWQDALKQSGGAFEPAWSSKMRAKLADIDLPRNVRLLAFQFAMNAPVSGLLVPWAVPWIRAMADFALAPLPEGLRVDGEKGLHYLLRDFMQLLLDESSAGGGWGGVVREARAEERREAEAAGDGPGDVSRQPLLGVGNRLVSHLMSVSSHPDGKTAMLRANVMLVAGLVGLFGDVFVEVKGEATADGHHGGGGQDNHLLVEGHQMGRRNDLQRLNLQYVVDMLKEREGHTGGAHASTKSTGVQAKHTILTGLNLLGVLLGRRVPVFVESAGPAANELARTLPDVCLSYSQKNAFETGAELLAMALAHVKWLRDGGGLPPEDDLCAALRGGAGTPSGGGGGADGEWLVRRVTDRLMRMGKDGKLRSRFVHAVAAIARVYPAVLTRKLLLESLRAMQFAEAACRGRFLAMLADNIPSGQVPDLEVQDLFTILQPHLPSLLLEPDVEFVRGSKETGQESEWVPMAQLSALRLLRALTKTMTSKQLGAVLGEDDAHSLMGLATPSTYQGCREIAYAALLDLHVAARESTASSKQGRSPEQDDDARGGAALTSAQREAVRCALLRGLSDPDDEGMAFDDKAASDEATTAHTTDDSNDPSRRHQQHPRRGIRRSLLNVFDAPPSEGGGGLEEDPGRRMLALMRDMFDARTARAWLRFAPYLLLRPAEKAPGYKDVLFKKSLSSCEFVDMPVVGGGGGFEARPMEPAFSFASLSSQQSQDAAGGASYGGGGGGGGSYGTLTTDVDVRGAGRLRATQDYLWAATQGAGGGVGAGKEPGARAGSAGVRTSHVAFPSQTQGKMLGVSYAGSQAVMPPPPPRAPGTGGKEPRSSQGGVGRRFWRTSGGSMSSMTKGETLGIQRRMAAKRARDKATRTKRAVIYRKYRDGELPDIMIKLGDVLRPLQHLSMLDGGIAREVFVQIFKEVYSGLGGTARAPIAAAPLPSDDGGDNGCTPEELENEIRREAAGGEGRRAVAVLLQKMLSSARHDTDVVACLHAACRATSTAAANPLGSMGGDGGRSGPSPSSSASSSALQDRRHVGQQQRAGSHLIGAASRSSSSSSSTVVPRGRARNSKQKQQEAGRDAPGGTGAGTAAEEGDAISLSPNLVASTALSSLNIHSGILLLEDSIMRTGRERAAADASVNASGAASVGGGQQQRRRRGAKAAQETDGKANVVVDVEKGQQDSWLQLSKLYAALGERDALVGVAARASKSEETRHALEAELSGDYESALEIYRKLMDRYDTRYEKDDFDSQHSARGMEKGEEIAGAQKDDNGVVASEAELRAWDMHQLECMRQLGQWKELQGEVVSMLSEYDDEGETADSAQFGGEDERGSAECQRRVWGAEPSRRDDLLPFFVWSIVHDHRRSEIALSAFLDAIVDPAAPPLQLADSAWEGQGASAAGAGAAEGAIAHSSPHGSSSSSCTRLAWLEKNMPGELAKAFLLGGRLGRAHQCVARCYDRFQEKWAGLHSCADSARRDQLRGLQLVVEVEDFLAFHDQKATAAGAAGGLPGRVSGLLDQWSRQSPSDTLDPVTSWSAIIAHRRDCFTAIEGDLEQVDLSSQPQGLDCRRDMLQHTADLSLVAAGAAIRQGVKKVAQQLINSYTRLKKKAGGLSPTDKQPKTLQTQGTAAQGEDLRLALIKVDFNAAKLERLRLAGTGGVNDFTAKRVKIITETLHVLDGYISQQERAMDTDALRDGRGWIEGEDGVGMSDYAEARETRLRLLTLQGQWLEMQGNMLVTESSSSSGADEEGRRHGATASFQGALASLEQATQLGDRLLASPSPSDQRSDAPDSGPIGSNPSSGKGRGSAKPQADIAAATGEAMLRLAKLCEGLAGGKVGGGGAGRDVEGARGRGREELAALAVKEYLRAMAVGSTSAMDRFPRVLVLAGEFPKARQAFADGAPAVPAWAFLRWVSQMLGVSGRKEGPVVIQVLERVALAYPRALFYPLLMTKASMKEGTSVGASGTSGNNYAQRLSKLTAITFDPSGEAFAEALRGLHHPELRFTDQMQHVLKLLVKGEKGLAQKAYRQMREDCLVIAGRKTGDEKVGTYNREFAKTRISKVDKSLGKGGEHMDPRKIVAWIAEARKWTMKAKNDAASGRMKLSQFSGWMSDFDSNKHSLEVPGQYGGITAAPPRVSHHSRIVSFGSELLVMGSLRVPKRLTIHGDDERDHMFLVKGGEDLRVDQRVEQLFEVMNAVMAKSASCSRARLSNKTYKVVPVTPDIGLIEWVQNTRPLKSVIEQGLGVSKLWDLPATGTFLSFVGSSRHAYHDMFKKRGRHETEAAFAKCCAAVPTDTLRQHLLAMAPSPEAFLTCRRGFARSLATLNACSYILGIGDRHLDNFLLDTSTGTVVGIDFGAAFGVGTTELPVPEMIPFRLTNQFQNLLQPLDSVGLLKGHMVSTLQALRGGSEVLLATMDVFLNEPVMEWISYGTQKRQKTTAKKGGDSGEEGGDPEIGEGEEGGGSPQPRPPSEAGRKIRNAERKLLGENPASVLIDDLEQNKKARAQGSLEKLKAIAWGRSGDRVRSKPENSAGLLSVEDQVECLIDLATDPDVLGRQYVGLATWI